MTFGGPLTIVFVGGGGERPTWPPDRPIEWWVFGIVTVGYIALLLTCILDASQTLRRQRREASRSNCSSIEPSSSQSSQGPEGQP